LRHDKEKAYSRYGFPGGDVLLLHVLNKKMFEDLGRTSTLTVELSFGSGTSGVAVFDVSQFTEALKLLPADCK
jgi:hypothetical protein